MLSYMNILVLSLLHILSWCIELGSGLESKSDAINLRAINVADFETAVGLRRRSEEHLASFDLGTHSQFYYAAPGDDGRLVVANMTLYAPDGLQIVSMERFEGYTSAVDCKGDDGSMSLTFNSEAAFNYAVQTWAWINGAAEKQFLLIANHDGCGPQDERQPYLITHIREDAPTLTTFLTAQVAPWSEVAGTYEVDFGKIMAYKPAKRSKRSVFPRGLLSSFGSTEISKSVTFNVAAGTPGQRTSILNNQLTGGVLKVDCVDCYIKGAFHITGHLSVKNFKLQDLTIDVSPQDFLAKVEFDATVTGTAKITPVNYQKELLSAPIPGAGIAVTGFFKLGAVISYTVGFAATFGDKNADFTFGLAASLPNTGKLTADIENPSLSTSSGFDGGSLTPSFDVKTVTAAVNVDAFSQPKLTLGVDIDVIGHVDVAVVLKIPDISATLTAGWNQSGFCDTNPGSSTTGVKLDSQVGIELDLLIEAALGSSNVKPSWSKKLWGISHPLLSKCFPLNIPGIRPVPSNTITPLPSALSTVSVVHMSSPGIPGLPASSVLALSSISPLPLGAPAPSDIPLPSYPPKNLSVTISAAENTAFSLSSVVASVPTLSPLPLANLSSVFTGTGLSASTSNMTSWSTPGPSSFIDTSSVPVATYSLY